jgi:hypothetical protein
MSAFSFRLHSVFMSFCDGVAVFNDLLLENFMRFTRLAVCLTLPFCCSLLIAQDQPASNPQKPEIYAQKLVDETLAKHKDVVVMAFHVTPPDQSDNVIIASNIGRIGKKADEDDMRVINTGESNLEVNKAGNHFEDELPLLDQHGNRIGAVGIVFNYKAGDDKTKLAKAAEAVRDEMSKQIPSKEKLFQRLTE